MIINVRTYEMYRQLPNPTVVCNTTVLLSNIKLLITHYSPTHFLGRLSHFFRVLLSRTA